MTARVDVKVVLLGQEFGGKTSLVERFLNDRFMELPYQNTIGASYGAKILEVKGKRFSMGIWDTAGGERYEAMSRIYYRGAFAAIVCYDLTDQQSFERAKFWMSEVQENEETCRVYLCGTKKDLADTDSGNRKVSNSLILRYAAGFNVDVFETSSKSGENVNEVFTKIIKDYADGAVSKRTANLEGTVRLGSSPKKFMACC